MASKLLILERETGLEPATSSLGSWHSTTELLPRSVTCGNCESNCIVTLRELNFRIHFFMDVCGITHLVSSDMDQRLGTSKESCVYAASLELERPHLSPKISPGLIPPRQIRSDEAPG